MNQSPLNYVAALGVTVVMWFVTAILLSGLFIDSVSLTNLDVQVFRGRYQLILALGALLSYLLMAYWFYYGNRNATVEDLHAARRRWMILFWLNIILAAALTVIMILLHLTEGLTPGNYLVMALMVSVTTFFCFWLCTFLMSPLSVKYVILFRK